ncbi:hypothetical protein SAMN04487771_10532 [[Clostridium] aminophilum]|uniref:Uncharacterized protein n=1 Tax=[Clostridium] aminophilum TaxID=1526 RepID=A0A1I0HLD7_9FIRM|nr:hypothetical protein [[Clostridium] aminophilum]SET84794.1 hypothetical protein SAMN04487771_10532 [[Clostridium] aminophilum]
MKKRITAGILAASYLSISTVSPAMAGYDNPCEIVNTDRNFEDDIETSDKTGLSVTADDGGNEDMSVNVGGGISVGSTEPGDYITGLEVNHEREDQDGDITVTVGGDIEVSNNSPDDEPSIGTGVSVNNDGKGDVSVWTGSITSRSETEDAYTKGIDTSTSKGETTIDVGGDVTADSSYGYANGIISENSGGNTNLVVSNDVTAHSIEGDATGFHSENSSGNTTLEVGNNITAQTTDGDAIGFWSDNSGGTTNAEIGGAVEASSIEGSAIGAYVNGYRSDEKAAPTTEISIDGGVSANSVTSEATGIRMSAEDGATVEVISLDDVNASSGESEATGLELGARNGKAYADILENVSATSDKKSATGVIVVLNGESSVLEANIYENILALGNDDSAGIKIIPIEPDIVPYEKTADMVPYEKTPDTTATVWVAGDVVSTGTGILDLDSINSGKTNVVIEGTLNAKGTSVVLAKNAADNLNLTVWKIDTAKKKSIAMEQTEKGLKYSKAAKAFEKTIDYILKVDKNTDGTVKFVDSRKKEITDHDGITSDYNVGHVGETVSVKLNVPDGYYIVAAYSDEAQRTSLRKDRYGEYYLTVPTGGGVMVSLKMAPIVKTGGDDSDDGGNPPAGYGQESEPQIQAPAELVPTKTAIDKGILSASVGSDNSVVLSSEDLGNFIASGGTQFCLRTQGSEFIISAEMLNGLNADGQPLRIVFTGNAIEIYVGTSATAAKTIPVTSGETAAAGVAATAVAEDSARQAETNDPSLAAQTHTAAMVTSAATTALAESSDTSAAAINLQTNGNSGFQPFAAFSGGASRVETG